MDYLFCQQFSRLFIFTVPHHAISHLLFMWRDNFNVFSYTNISLSRTIFNLSDYVPIVENPWIQQKANKLTMYLKDNISAFVSPEES